MQILHSEPPLARRGFSLSRYKLLNRSPDAQDIDFKSSLKTIYSKIWTTKLIFPLLLSLDPDGRQSRWIKCPRCQTPQPPMHRFRRQATFPETKKPLLPSPCHLSAELEANSASSNHTQTHTSTKKDQLNKSRTKAQQSGLIVPHETLIPNRLDDLRVHTAQVSIIYPLRYCTAWTDRYVNMPGGRVPYITHTHTHTRESSGRSYLVGTYFGNKR